jgi:Inorganic H+ pyrophosphatase
MSSVHGDDLEGGGINVVPGGLVSPMMARSSSISSENNVNNVEMDPLHPSGKQRKRKKHMAGGLAAFATNSSPDKIRFYGIVVVLGTLCICPFVSIQWAILTLVYASCIFGCVATLWLSRSVLQCDDGTAEMRAVSDPIREGAEGFLHVQYTAIAKFAIPLAGLIVLSYQFRPHGAEGEDGPKGVAILGNTILGVVAASGFAFGAICSAISGYISMW